MTQFKTMLKALLDTAKKISAGLLTTYLLNLLLAWVAGLLLPISFGVIQLSFILFIGMGVARYAANRLGYAWHEGAHEAAAMAARKHQAMAMAGLLKSLSETDSEDLAAKVGQYL